LIVSLAQRSTLACVAAAVVAAIGNAAPAAAGAVLQGKRIGAAASIVGTDGVRFAAWRPLKGHVTRVFDASDGHTAVVADPLGCGAPVIGAGALLFTCALSRPGDAAGAWIVDLKSGLGRPAVPEQLLDGDGRVFVAVGRRWLQATVSSYHRQVSAFYDRATGDPYDGASPFGPQRQPDVDRSTLVRSICSPLRAPADGFSGSPPQISDGYVPLLFSGVWALDTGPRVLSPRQLSHVTLRRCRSERHRVICRIDCGSPFFTGGQVVWADGLNLLTYRLRDGRRRALHARSGDVTGAWRLGRRVLVGVRRDTGTSPPSLSVRLVTLTSEHK
jgi:hypothetical protein